MDRVVNVGDLLHCLQKKTTKQQTVPKKTREKSYLKIQPTPQLNCDSHITKAREEKVQREEIEDLYIKHMIDSGAEIKRLESASIIRLVNNPTR